MQRTLYGLARSIAYKALAKHRRATPAHLQASSTAAASTSTISEVGVEGPSLCIPSADAKKAFADLVSEANKRELSGSENFDKSVLTLSSAGLGLSLTFLKDFVHLSSATTKWALYGSWIAFTLATLGTMLSFICSGRAQRLQVKAAEDYYICGDELALTRANKWGRCNSVLNGLACVAFISALILAVVFIWSNVEGDPLMSKPFSSSEQRGGAASRFSSPTCPGSRGSCAIAPGICACARLFWFGKIISKLISGRAYRRLFAIARVQQSLLLARPSLKPKLHRLQ